MWNGEYVKQEIEFVDMSLGAAYIERRHQDRLFIASS